MPKRLTAKEKMERLIKHYLKTSNVLAVQFANDFHRLAKECDEEAKDDG